MVNGSNPMVRKQMNATLQTAQQIHEASEPQSFETIFLAHYDRVYGILYRLLGSRDEAEDAAQEVFLKLYQRPPSADANVGAWLYRVATNTGYNVIRGRKRRWQWQRWLVPAGDAPSPADLLEDDQRRDAVRTTLAQLKPRQAQLLLLRHMGLSYQELAEACDIKPASVGKQLARATEAFRAHWKS